MTTPSKPLAFFDLPREIRDEIYRQYFSRGYRFPRFKERVEIDNSMMLLREPMGPRTSSHSRILQISQRMRCEAEEIFYKECSFHLDAAKPWPSAELCQTLAYRITKLEVDMVAWSESSYLDPILKRFMGGELGRKFCSFTIPGGDTCIDTSVFITLLEELIRYETVILRLWVPEAITKQLPGKELCQGRRKADWPPMVQHEIFYFKKALYWLEKHRNTMRTVLESTLGPGEMFDEGSYHCVEFHPMVHSTRQHC